MKRSVVLSALILIGLAAGASEMLAQQSATPPPTWMPDIKFQRGREVVPYLEGWIKNPDGTFDFVFGYYNRNQEQDLFIPPGPDNLITPGPQDQGQPTYFMAKRQPRIFRLRVPKDFGDKSVTWAITANGHTEKVVAKLVPAYEKEEKFIETNNNTTIELGQEDMNKPPTIAVAPPASAGVNAPVALAARVTDDGLPKPRSSVRFDDPDRPQEPSEPDPLARFKSQRNGNGGRRPSGLRVTWQVYRGPAKVSFDALTTQVDDGKAVNNVRFAAAGTYTLIATASDGKLIKSQRFDVQVK
jgi:hypothetical protein